MIVLFFISSKQTAMVLLDLIGANNTMFHNLFEKTNDLYERLQLIGMYVFSKFICLNVVYVYITATLFTDMCFTFCYYVCTV